VCFLDISRAFDSVWIDGLLWKVHNAGIQGKLWNWIRAFLSNRSFFLSVDGLTSESFILRAGVPQGCVLSPFLFLIFINDLTERQDPLSLTLTFADDVALFPALNALSRPLPVLFKSLQKTLTAFTKWAAFWRISFSPTKSNLVLFSRQRTPPSPPFPLMLSSFALPCVDSYKYLGITLDNQFNFNLHSDKIVDTVRTQCSLLNRTISFSSSPQPLTIRSLLLGKVYSILSYGLPFWSPSAKTLNKLVSLISTPLCLSLGLPVFAPRTAILIEFRLLPPSILRQRLIHSFFHSLARSADSPFKSLYEHQRRHPPAKSFPKYAHHLTSSLLKIDDRISLPHTDDFESNYNAFSCTFMSNGWMVRILPNMIQQDLWGASWFLFTLPSAQRCLHISSLMKSHLSAIVHASDLICVVTTRLSMAASLVILQLAIIAPTSLTVASIFYLTVLNTLSPGETYPALYIQPVFHSICYSTHLQKKLLEPHPCSLTKLSNFVISEHPTSSRIHISHMKSLPPLLSSSPSPSPPHPGQVT